MKEKSIDEIIINVPLSFRHLHLISECLPAVAIHNISRNVDITAYWHQCQQITGNIVDAIRSANLPPITQKAALEYVTDIYFELIRNALEKSN